MRQGRLTKKPIGRKDPKTIIFSIIFAPAICFGFMALLSFSFEEQHRMEKLASIVPQKIPESSRSATNSDHLDEASICFQQSRAGCEIVGCKQSATSHGTHYRGLVRKVNIPPAELPFSNRTCEVCDKYLRQCAVSVEHKFIYIHVMKSGGSSFHHFLKRALCRPNDMHLQDPGKKMPEFICRESVFQLMACESAIAKYPNFFKWSFVRHPIPRAVSAWAMATKLSNTTPTATISFNEWALDPSKLSTQLWEMHWWPQSSFLMRGGSGGGGGTCPMYDFVGTFGVGFDRDLAMVLRRINSRTLTESYRADGFPHDHQTASAVRQAVYGNISAAARHALVRRYRMDLEVFGFEPDSWCGEFY